MKTLCPFCFEEYDVDASSMFQEATCLKCDKKFFVQPAKKCKVCGVYYDAAKVTCRNCGAVDSAEIESTAELHGQKYTDTGNGEEIFEETCEITPVNTFTSTMLEIYTVTASFFTVAFVCYCYFSDFSKINIFKALSTSLFSALLYIVIIGGAACLCKKYCTPEAKSRLYKFFNVMYRIYRITTLFFWVAPVVLVLLNGLGLAIRSLFISTVPLAGIIIFHLGRNTISPEDTVLSDNFHQYLMRLLSFAIIPGLIICSVALFIDAVLETREEKRIRQEELDKKWQEKENRRWEEEAERRRQEAEWRRQEAERQRQENDRKCRELEENTRRWQEAERQRQEAEQQKRREGRELEENNQKWQEAEQQRPRAERRSRKMKGK